MMRGLNRSETEKKPGAAATSGKTEGLEGPRSMQRRPAKKAAKIVKRTGEVHRR